MQEVHRAPAYTLLYTPGVAKPVQDPKDSARIRILRGAAEAFGRLGYSATSVEQILEASRVSRRTFYKVFRNKEEVLGVLFDNSVQMLLKAVRAAHPNTRASASARAEAAVEAYIRVHAEAGALARVLLLEQFSPDSPLAQQRERAMEQFHGLLMGAVGQRDGDEPDTILVHGVVAAINQVCVQMANEYPEGNWDVERAKRAILRILGVLGPGAEAARAAPT